jgi:acetyl/propionyl-CoA carboxylase alpha subunit
MNARLQVGHPITTGERVTVTGKDGLLVDYRP